MKKLNRVIRGLTLLALFASLVLQCSKEDSGGSAPSYRARRNYYYRIKLRDKRG